MLMKKRKQNIGVPLCRDCAWYYGGFMKVSLLLDERARFCHCLSCGKPGLRMSFDMEKRTDADNCAE